MLGAVSVGVYAVGDFPQLKFILCANNSPSYKHSFTIITQVNIIIVVYTSILLLLSIIIIIMAHIFFANSSIDYLLFIRFSVRTHWLDKNFIQGVIENSAHILYISIRTYPRKFFFHTVMRTVDAVS